MKTLLIGILAIGSLSSHASMLEVNGPLDGKFLDAQVNDEKTYFETLGDLFKAGTRPNVSKISNIAWAGRCFSKGEQNEPTNAGYIFRPKRNDAGPIATTSKAYEASSYWNLDKGPNFFDKMDLEQIFAGRHHGRFNDVRLKTDSIEVDVGAPNKSNLKVSGNYLVEEISGPVGNVGPLGKVNVGLRCYYFIPELNP